MKKETFAKELKTQYVPSYAYPRIEPIELWDYFKAGRIVKERLINKDKKSILLLDSKAQQSIWNSLLKLKSFGDMNIVISSEINDYMAHEVAALLNLHYVRKHINLKYLWTTPNYTFNKVDITTKLLFIRSVLPEKEKLYQIRDIFDKHPNAVKVLIIGGINGIDFFDDYLRIPLHSAIHIEGTYEKIPNRYYLKQKEEESSSIPPFVIPTSVIPQLNVLRT